MKKIFSFVGVFWHRTVYAKIFACTLPFITQNEIQSPKDLSRIHMISNIFIICIFSPFVRVCAATDLQHYRYIDLCLRYRIEMPWS